LFQRWSIPLAFLIPGAIVLMEHLNNIGGTQGGRPIADYLAYRLQGPFGGQDEDMDVLLSDGAAWRMLSDMFTQTNWVQVGIGLVFTGAVIYLASEYRRRRIEA
jgi:ABC-2 type transport system permease protein